MVKIDSQRHLPVRFLIKENKVRGHSAYKPWKLYYLPKSVLDRINIPYEVMEDTPLKIGSRIASMAKTMGFSMGSGGCCGSCSDLQKLIDAASAEWVIEHMDEIVGMMQRNAKKSFNMRFPKKMLELAVKSAIVLERRAVRHKHKQLTENQTIRVKKK